MKTMTFRDRISSIVERNRQFFDGMKFRGIIMTEVYRRGRLIEVVRGANDVVLDGKNLLLNSFFTNIAPPSGWFQGLIDAAGFTGSVATDTMATHTGWVEFTSYSQATRQAWTPPASTAASLLNSTTMSFTMTAAGTLQGGFLTTSNTKGGTVGNLWSTAFYGTPIVVGVGDVIQNTYGISC